MSSQIDVFPFACISGERAICGLTAVMTAVPYHQQDDPSETALLTVVKESQY